MSGILILERGEYHRQVLAARPRYVIGLDLGQRRDWTALAVLEQTRERQGAKASYAVRQLDRTRQESYPAVADAVAELMSAPPLDMGTLALDETGVGAAVGDLLAEQLRRVWRVTITAGSVANRDGNRYMIPKRDLVGVVAVLLETRRLKVAEGLPHAATLIAELHNFKAKISASGHDQYGAGDDWREGNHDDLVLAVALACWMGEYGPSGKVWAL